MSDIQSNAHWNSINLQFPKNLQSISKTQLERQYELNIHKFPQQSDQWIKPDNLQFNAIKRCLVNLQVKDYRVEQLIAQKIYYINRNQHKTGKYFKKYEQVLRIVKRLYQMSIEDTCKRILALFFNISNKNQMKSLPNAWSHIPNMDWLKFSIQYFTGVFTLCDKGLSSCELLFNYLVQLLQTQEYVPLAIILMSIVSRLYTYLKLMKADSKLLVLLLTFCVKMTNSERLMNENWTLKEFLPKPLVNKKREIATEESKTKINGDKSKKKKKKKVIVNMDDDLGEPI